jgi:hypothetical protein
MGGGKKTVMGPDVRIELAPFFPIGDHTQRADLAAPITLPPPNTDPAPTKIIVQAFDQHIRYTIDGALPQPTFGFRLVFGSDPIMLTVAPGTVLRFCEEAATATLAYVWGQ